VIQPASRISGTAAGQGMAMTAGQLVTLAGLRCGAVIPRIYPIIIMTIIIDLLI